MRMRSLRFSLQAAVLCCAGVQVEVTMDEDEEPEVELTGDVGAPVDVSRVPIIVSVSQVRGKIQGLREAGREGVGGAEMQMSETILKLVGGHTGNMCGLALCVRRRMQLLAI
jgi:hypothetical protein